MGGRLRHFETAWRSLTDNPWVIWTVRGYELELVDSPQDAPPTTFQEEQPDLWDQVLELLHKGAEELAPVKSGFFSPMFVIPKKDGGARPIINLKRLNSHLRIQHFKMENILCLRDLLKRGDFMVKLDLKDAYLTIPIHANHRRLLRFICRGKAYQFCSLPFGLATAPRVFTKVTKPALSALRAESSGDLSDLLSGRHANYEFNTVRSKNSSREIYNSLGEAGIPYQLEEEHNRSSQINRVSGSSCGFKIFEPQGSGSEGSENSERMSSASEQGYSVREVLSSYYRIANFSESSCLAWPPSLQSPSEIKE